MPSRGCAAPARNPPSSATWSISSSTTSELKGAPVIYEANPTYFNLFGRIEHIIQMGNACTNFTMIKPGALHRAIGGYLILDCREVLINLFSYEALKRCIRNHEIKIEDMAEQFRLLATVSLKPEPIPLDCKIVFIGTPLLYYLLYQYDQDFRKYFKVKADFDRMMKNTWENVQEYARFIASKCQEEKILPFDRAGVARVVEYSVRLIEDKQKLSSRFLDIADLLREAAFYASRGKRATGSLPSTSSWPSRPGSTAPTRSRNGSRNCSRRGRCWSIPRARWSARSTACRST